MAVKEVIRMGHPTLRLKATPLSREEILSEGTRELITDLIDTMKYEEVSE